MRTFILASFLMVVPAAGQASFRVDPWSWQRLDLELRLRGSSIEMRGKGVVRLDRGESDGPAFAINSRKRVMHLREMRSGELKAAIAPFKGPSDAAKLTFDRLFKAGDTIEVEFMAESGERSSQFVITEQAAYASWVESWYPIPAQSLTELSSPAVAGTTTLVVPRGWRTAANGRLIEQQTKGEETRETWSSDVPVARSFVASPFTVTDRVRRGGRDVSLFLLKPRAGIAQQAGALAQSLAAMEKRFGPYPYPTYHIVEVPEDATFAAASEQGFIMVRSSLLDRETGNLPLFAHEAAHGWWGNLVRTDGPGGKMLSEALAQYGAVISIEAVEGRAAAGEFLRYSRQGYNPLQCALGYFHVWREGGDRPLAQLESARWDHTLADAKGHWFYHMLRDRIGDEAFFGALRQIIERFAGREATLSDLRAVMIAARPDDAGLPAFLSQWLDGLGAPVLKVDWWSVSRGKAIEIHIEQHEDLPQFVFDLDVAIETKDGRTKNATLEVCERRQTFVVATPDRATGLRLDPNDRLLIWRPEYGPRP